MLTKRALKYTKITDLCENRIFRWKSHIFRIREWKRAFPVKSMNFRILDWKHRFFVSKTCDFLEFLDNSSWIFVKIDKSSYLPQKECIFFEIVEMYQWFRWKSKISMRIEHFSYSRVLETRKMFTKYSLNAHETTIKLHGNQWFAWKSKILMKIEDFDEKSVL